MQIDRLSYCLGMNFAFSEAVGSGVKPLALSPPLETDEAETLLPPTRKIADEFGIAGLLQKPRFAGEDADITRER